MKVHSVNVFKYKFRFARNLLAAIILEFANLVANQFGSFSARNVKKKCVLCKLESSTNETGATENQCGRRAKATGEVSTCGCNPPPHSLHAQAAIRDAAERSAAGPPSPSPSARSSVSCRRRGAAPLAVYWGWRSVRVWSSLAFVLVSNHIRACLDGFPSTKSGLCLQPNPKILLLVHPVSRRFTCCVVAC